MQKKLFNRYYLCVWFGSLCLLLVHNMLNNALPLYLTSIGFSTSFSGLIGVPFAILGIVGRLLGGYLADSRSRRLVMVGGTALLGVSAFLFGLVPVAHFRASGINAEGDPHRLSKNSGFRQVSPSWRHPQMTE